MRHDKRYSQAKLYSIYTETSKKCTLIEHFRSSLDLNFQHLKNMGQMHPFCHKSLTLDKHPSTVSVSVSSETRSTEFEQRDPAFLPSPPFTRPLTYHRVIDFSIAPRIVAGALFAFHANVRD